MFILCHFSRGQPPTLFERIQVDCDQPEAAESVIALGVAHALGHAPTEAMKRAVEAAPR